MEIASDAGAQAIAKFDANKDGASRLRRIGQGPGLAGRPGKDQEDDQLSRSRAAESQLRSAKITAEEIDARIQEWKAQDTGRVNRALSRIPRE